MFEIKVPSIQDLLLRTIDVAEEVSGLFGGKKDFFAPGEQVIIHTMEDEGVCENCQDMAAGSPYSIEEARKQIPHHPGCRCYVTPMRSMKRFWLQDGHGFQSARNVIRSFGEGQRFGAEKTSLITGESVPQRNATIKQLHARKKKFLAPSGARRAKVERKYGRR
jgi:hypothetical protein